jgi:hypothetical protein
VVVLFVQIADGYGEADQPAPPGATEEAGDD